MRYHFISLVSILTITLSCQTKGKKDDFPGLLDLVIVDSVLVEEPNFFMNSQHHVKLIGDSLIGVSSYRSPSVGFYSVFGQQRKRIASGDYPVGSFSPTNFDISEYPIVHILDKRSQSILTFNVENQKLIKKIKIDLPDGKEIKYMGSKFKKLDIGFLIELASSDFENLNPKHYKESGNLIFLFDENGKIKSESEPFLTYPEEIKNLEGSISAIDYLKSSFSDESMYFTFAHERKIRRFDPDDFGKLLEEIPLPKSRFFDYQINSADQIYSFEEMRKSGEPISMSTPDNHYFNNILETSKDVIIQTWIINDEINGIKRTSHLLLYNKEKKDWSETSTPRNILDIGMLAGVANDTLYFFEGSLMKHDDKYIKRAVLKPIEK